MFIIGNLFLFIMLVIGNISLVYIFVEYLQELRREFYNYFHPEEALRSRIKKDAEFIATLDKMLEEYRKAVLQNE